MRQININELVLNEPLPWTVYDGDGNLLLREGYVLSLPRHIDSLLARGAYVKVQEGQADPEDEVVVEQVPPPSRHVEIREPVFARATRLANSLERLHADIQAGRLRNEMRRLVEGMAHMVHLACEQDADALLAALHTNRQHPYLVVQQLLGAAMTEIVAKEAQVDEATRTVWVCAALTRDVGMVKIQQILDQQTTPLTGNQMLLVQHHPDYAVVMLGQMGVTDPVWLQVVRQHQERNDGSGYPKALQQTEIVDGAKLLAIVDSYAAMVTPRANRVAKLPHEAMKVLHEARDSAYEQVWVPRVIKALTMFPPGSVVQLANGEKAVVRARATSLQTLEVWSFFNAQAQLLETPLPRATTDAPYAVVRPLALTALGEATHRVASLWG